MIRTQVQLTEDDYDALRQVAAKQNRSLADCIREGIALFLTKAEDKQEDFADIAGKFRPLDQADLKPHDQWWSEAIIAGKTGPSK
jgi:hypothetical protein